MVFLILVFGLGMAVAFLTRLEFFFPVIGSSSAASTSGMSPSLFRIFASRVGFGKGIVIAVSPPQLGMLMQDAHQ